MASPFAKYAALVFSIADYENGVGYSSVQDDFPFVLGPDVFFDHQDGMQRFVGRDPATGLPLIVTEWDRYTTTITADGVVTASDGISPPFGVLPDVCSLRVDVSAASVLADIEAAAKHLVYGVANVQPDAEPDDLPPALAPYYIDAVMPEAKWTQIYNGLLARGADQTRLDNWRANNPDATPREVHRAFGSLVQQLVEALG